ncbi:hypothetical protein MAR_010878 [Mya arenaria]|uniref:Uncharacterized protein n=1 Tax=Mya arenaria TaxID=6604 RepID=A0ABY7FWB3_MYAAR|nr:hypothetical protein MAR_010878 [Mya arenaria]
METETPCVTHADSTTNYTTCDICAFLLNDANPWAPAMVGEPISAWYAY